MQKHNKKLIVLVTVLLLVIGTSFAYFVSRIILEGKGAKTDTELVTLGDTTIRVDGTLEFNDKDIYPGHKNISSVKITATGDRLVVYNLTWEGNNTLAGLNYKVYKTTEEQAPTIICSKKEVGTIRKELYEECEENLTSLGEVISEGEIKTGEKLNIQLVMNESIQATSNGTKVYYYVVIEYPNIDDSQNVDMNGAFTGKVYIKTMKSSANCGSACQNILADNVVRSEKLDYSKSSAYYTYQGKQFYRYYTYNHGRSYSAGQMDDIFGIPKDAELYNFKMYNGETFSDAHNALADGSFLENSLGKGTWSGGKCTFNGKEVGKITSWNKTIDNEHDCNNIYRIVSPLHEYASFYEYEYIGKASEALEHTHGLFEGEDDDGTTFYFRGDIDNNYVKFGKWNDESPDMYVGFGEPSTQDSDKFVTYSSLQECEESSKYNLNCTLVNNSGKDMYWRIIGINGDGTIKLIYDGTNAHKNGESNYDRGIATGDFNVDNYVVGYMYEISESEPHEEVYENNIDSTIKKVIDNWYKININNTSFESYIDINQGFCGDRTVVEQDKFSNTNYIVYYRLRFADKFILEKTCSNENDLYTVSSSNRGNKALTYPVGLITADELVLGGLHMEQTKYTYLYSGGYGFWTMTPAYSYNVAFAIFGGSYLNDITVKGYPFALIRPVINLKANVKLSGSGTATDPYTIIEAN